MHILDKIVATKHKEVEQLKELYPTKLLEQSLYFNTLPVSLCNYLARKDKIGIIAEIKRKSPSEGDIHPYISVEQLSIGYMQAGASALSILTDQVYFGGSDDDLKTARKFNFCPILRKDFIIDEYQIIQARSMGADVILLIARILEPKQMKRLAAFAKSLDLEVLLEVHSAKELESSLCDSVDIVGVNNRDLDTFEVSIDKSLKLVGAIPSEFTKISESGLRSAKEILTLKQAGYQGFLIGSSFMRYSRPEEACARLIKEIQSLEKQAQSS